MTEHTVPMAGTALAEPPAPVLPPGVEDDTADAGNRRKLLLVGGALGAVVVLLAAYFLLKGGSDTPAASGAPLLPHHVAAAPAKAHHAKATKPLKLPKPFKGNVGRDPFKPLYTAPVAAPSGSTPGSAPDTGQTGSPTTSTTDGSTPSTSSSGGGTTTHAPVYRPIWLQLRQVSPKGAVFVVGYSNRHSLKVLRFIVKAPTGTTGRVFANAFSLLSVSGNEATVQYGDGTPFVLDLQHNTMIVN